MYWTYCSLRYFRAITHNRAVPFDALFHESVFLFTMQCSSPSEPFGMNTLFLWEHSLCAPGGAERQWAARGENSRNGRTYTWRDPNTAQRLYRKHKKNILKTIKLTENTDIRKAMAIHCRETSDGQEHWLMHWGWLKSDQTSTQADMLAVFPLTMARDRHWWSHCRSLGSPEMSTSFFARQLKKGAVDLPYTPVVSIATGWK